MYNKIYQQVLKYFLNLWGRLILFPSKSKKKSQLQQIESFTSYFIVNKIYSEKRQQRMVLPTKLRQKVFKIITLFHKIERRTPILAGSCRKGRNKCLKW